MACIAGTEVPTMSSPLMTSSQTEFRYRGITNLVEQIKNAPGDTLVIQHVSVSDFDQIFSEREKMGLGFRLSLYTANLKQLIVTIPTGVHEELHRSLDDSILEKIFAMGLRKNDLKSVGAKAYADRDGAGNLISQGEGDSCRLPRVRQIPGHYGWPTIVIEAGYTQSLLELRIKARWWFAKSNLDVKIVILAKFQQSQGMKITIEKWKAVVPPHGVMTQAQAQANVPAQPAPSCVQAIYIMNPNGINFQEPASYCVTEPLQVEFQDLFLREPVEGEHDIVFTIPDLQNYAVGVWESYSQ